MAQQINIRHFHPAYRASAALVLLVLAACSPPNSAFYNRGTPESLLDVSSEVVSLGVSNKKELDALASWIEKDRPTRAELYCDITNKECRAANHLFESKGVPTVLGGAENGSVKLFYERILARDCNQRYVDQGFSWYNVEPPAVGCSVAANMVQQVSNKREFVNPNLSDDPSAVGAVDAMRRVNTPKAITPAYNGQQDSAIKTSGGSGN